MRQLKQLEPLIDIRITETTDALRRRFMETETAPDLAAWTRYYVYDTITTLLYGRPVGMIEQGRDVDNLIESWHDMFTMGGLVATLPWLVHPVITSWLFKDYLMPRKGHKGGSGHIMSVCYFFVHHLSQLLTSDQSPMRSFSSTVWKGRNLPYLATCSTVSGVQGG